MVEQGEIIIDNVRRVFPAQVDGESAIEAVNHVSAEIKPGEFVALIGPSGCGKSTLLRMLAGLDRPTNGKVLVDGAEIKKASREIGLVFQDPTLYPWLTVEKKCWFWFEIGS